MFGSAFDAFSYQAVDSDGARILAITTVVINITEVNDAPTANGDGYSLSEDGTLVVGAVGSSPMTPTPTTPTAPPATRTLYRPWWSQNQATAPSP